MTPQKLAIIALLGLFALSACNPVYRTNYRFTAPPTDFGKMCASGCIDKLNACNSNCLLNQANCQRIEELNAENAYLRYVDEQNKKNLPVERDKQYFNKSYSKCSASACEAKCEEQQRICHSTCGGDIIEERYCTAFCD